jgi:UDP-sulfoquinovose synthase
MKIIVLGADGYLGWPTSMHFSALGDEVYAVDNFNKRKWELEEGIEPLWSVPTLHKRVERWKEVSGKQIHLRVGDLCNHRFVYKLLEEVKPDAIIHYAEQPSAPYSMQSRSTAVDTQVNNVVGTMNLLFAMQASCPQAHLVKLGTMGEYGTPNIDIEEGYLTVNHNGREDTVLYPKKPGSFYHLSKVHDSNNIYFACRMWGVTATDLNQGVVYGLETEQTRQHEDLRTSFHYDDVFGTVLNRFLIQAACGKPLTVYGKGGQTRGFLNIKDTLQCVELATRNPAEPGEFRVLNQFTEQFSVMDLAEKVVAAGERAGLKVQVNHLENPRIEMEQHYYNAKHSKFKDLGLKPHLLTDEVVDGMLAQAQAHSEQVNAQFFTPRIPWAAKKK